jgi:hypothetical protein
VLPKQVVRTFKAEMETFLILVDKKVLLSANILNIHFHIKIEQPHFGQEFLGEIYINDF